MEAATELRRGTGSPVDWSLAISTGQRLVRRGPDVPIAEAEATVRDLRDATDVAEGHVRDLTGLGHGLPLPPGEVVDRPGWIKAAADGLDVLTDGALPRAYAGPVGAVMAGSAGVQAGMVLAFLGARVLGQYDPFNDGRLLLVAPNIIGAHRALDVPSGDFRMWVCLHECTHRLQFTAVPWLKDYFSGQVRAFLSGMDDSAASALNRFPDVIREARRRSLEPDSSSGPVTLMELLQSAEQREVFDRLIALSTLLEGHADYVMDAVGPTVVPTVDVIRDRFSERRRGGGLLDRVLRTLLGVDAKVKQYEAGAAFTRHVVGQAGMDGFNAVWTDADTLPRRTEITDPDAWLRRVRP
nr:zinc-dependent metalloprotease [Kibdelosporangium sp. MJ126-NF4]CEL23280.1 FIG021250: possible hydrolase [Kibdelosporangium sp. MJ126-NF4]CTQ94441.1 FIG021250: possible hydrolase [Kibdelosporangium sp. MJ126-NF4]